MRTTTAAFTRLSAALLLHFSSDIVIGGMWDPAPLTVHEWGVNTFDWDRGDRLQQELPDFLYTDQKPGKQAARTGERVRDLPADSGVRTKPILYFYPKTPFAMEKPPQVGVEVRFADGYANAWWPQVNRYRTEAESLAAKAPDWDGWTKQMLALVENAVKGNGSDPKAVARWEAELKKLQSLDEPDRIAWLVNRTSRYGTEPDVPEDDRMQLTWDQLTLHEKIPEGLSLPGEELPDAHWVKIAREVDAAYVSNGTETERYVFYEGKTRERPAIALLPESTGPFWMRSHAGEAEPQGVAVINIGEHPIHDVIAVYRDREKDILWTGHVAMLPALPEHRPLIDQVVALRVPDFNRLDAPPVAAQTRLEAAEFDRLTRERLIEALTAGYHYDPGGVTMRDPADPQPPARLHQLFPKEARALERIWHEDFFESEGLTVIYRESPAYLDEAMPLNIYTSMFQYVKLSRCGLVLNRNLPIAQVREVDRALQGFASAQSNNAAATDVEKMKATLRSSRFLTLGMARYRYGREGVGFWGGFDERTMEKVEGLFD